MSSSKYQRMNVKFYADSLEDPKYWSCTKVEKAEDLSSGLMTLPKALKYWKRGELCVRSRTTWYWQNDVHCNAFADIMALRLLVDRLRTKQLRYRSSSHSVTTSLSGNPISRIREGKRCNSTSGASISY